MKRQQTLDSYDFIIIGGGIAGASIAYELSRSASCLLLEQEQAFGYHTSGRSAATYIELLHNQTIVALSRNSLPFLANPPSGFSDAPLMSDCGCLVVGSSSDQQQLDTAFEQAQQLGTRVQRYNAEQIAQAVPVLNTGPEGFDGGLFEPDAKRIDVAALLQGYLKGTRAHGGKTLSNAEVANIEYDSERWRISAGNTTYHGAVLINAAGAWSDRIAEMAGLPAIGLTPKKRTMITFDAPAETDISSWPMVGDLQESFYFVPETGQLMGSPADETPAQPCDIQPDELDIATAVYHIEQNTRLKINKINHKWAGLRTFAPDRLPVIGYEPDQPAFFWFAGQGGFGIQTAPAAAQLGSALALRKLTEQTAAAIGLDPAQLSPTRFR